MYTHTTSHRHTNHTHAHTLQAHLTTDSSPVQPYNLTVQNHTVLSNNSSCMHKTASTYVPTYIQTSSTVEPLYRGYHWDPAGCTVKRGVPNSEVDLYTAQCGWDCGQYPH